MLLARTSVVLQSLQRPLICLASALAVVSASNMAEIKLRTLRDNPSPKKSIDCYQQFRDTFVELPPLATSLETGEILNDTASIKLVPGEKIDIQNYVNSFYDSSCLQVQLERLRAGDRSAVVPAGNGVYADISGVPDDLEGVLAYSARLKAESLAKAESERQAKADADKAKADFEAKAKADNEAYLKKLIADALAQKGN